ncbi:hypothetical protein Y032_0576g219 [Ancylostoma ceylanicum]|uniref:Uncharacterized protein n=1 Tax=Ancylostoma ceylanicum TaxID=53326 RepID=A0A016WNK6_9BILA|nr:hypothetical protein Y032_0576g219 [Ancylostoma ceylanicum]
MSKWLAKMPVPENMVMIYAFTARTHTHARKASVEVDHASSEVVKDNVVGEADTKKHQQVNVTFDTEKEMFQ